MQTTQPVTFERKYRAETAGHPGEEQSTQAQMERWERCLRTQIFRHPRISLGTGLVLGLLVGVWVKR